ncbi:hypothetical protein BOX37_17760 [Nocardia mangyaensis]|uniref:Uncharacterized protein n=1 Tax=Nocardia mangyaensis TaxID=2213200 RepID=A0A1J0VTZ6_9NOCA|nr:hypothetical protein [Nocardia mangyaensis]APE35489.1 hypothetical protein BOX37_17760 [Nocardia mangyaensis]
MRTLGGDVSGELHDSTRTKKAVGVLIVGVVAASIVTAPAAAVDAPPAPSVATGSGDLPAGLLAPIVCLAQLPLSAPGDSSPGLRH